MTMALLKIQRETGFELREVDSHGRVNGQCPGCGANPFLVVCGPSENWGDYEIRAGARCVKCNDPVGWVYAPRKTIFGAEEDRNVLERGRCRVY